MHNVPWFVALIYTVIWFVATFYAIPWLVSLFRLPPPQPNTPAAPPLSLILQIIATVIYLVALYYLIR